MIADLRLAVRMAGRELRGGVRGFRVFLACLAVGVAVIAGVGSLGRAVLEGLRADARVILGGDVEFRLVHRPAAPEERAWLAGAGKLSETTEMRAMARVAGGADADPSAQNLDSPRGFARGADANPSARNLDSPRGFARGVVELKAVDALYPLHGAVTLNPDIVLEAALERRGGIWGAVADDEIARRIGAKPGDRLAIGEGIFELRATIVREPDKGTGVFRFGPRVMVAAEALDSTGLAQTGSLYYRSYRIELGPGADADAFLAETGRKFPQAGWRMRSHRSADPGLRRFVDRMTLFLVLVGLTALLVGGVGVGNAVRAHLESKTATIAIHKCLGASGRLVFLSGFVQVMALAMLGSVAGAAAGVFVPLLAAPLLADRLPFAARLAVYPAPLMLAVAFGLLVAAAFSLWPLARARLVSPAALFRDLLAPVRARPRLGDVAATAVAAAALAGLALLWADDRKVALWFVAGAAASLVAFRLAAFGVARLARALPRPGVPALRLAIANLHRPGAPTVPVVVSLGLGLTVLVAVAQIEGNLAREVDARLPKNAPAFYFIDIQPDQVEEFDRIAGAIPGAVVERVPTVRARVVALGGVPAEARRIAPEVAWVVRGDRALTYAAKPPARADIVAGAWWAHDYRGPPLVSFDAEAARGMDLKLGDTVTVNVLGRDITARIANLRRIDWGDLSMNFVMIFAPGTLETAPHTHLAAAHVAAKDEDRLMRAVTDRFANVSAIRVKDALEAASRIVEQAGAAVRATALVAILVGALVLAGAIAAGHRRRVYDAVVLKVLGATRRDLAAAFALEHGLLGAVTASIACAVGTLAAWVVVTRLVTLDWTFLPGTVAGVAALGLGLTLVFGFAGTWRALGHKAAPLLRNP